MSTTAQFRSSLQTVGSDSVVVGYDELGPTVDKLAHGPVVGAPLPFETSLGESSAINFDPTAAELRNSHTGVSGSELGVASVGTVAIESRPHGDEIVSLYPQQHLLVIREGDIVPDVATAFRWLGDRFAEGRRSIILATGPSATADMGELVTGVHGPHEVTVVILADE